MRPIVVDRFSSFPDFAREYALDADFKQIEHHGLNYYGIAEAPDHSGVKQIEALVGEHIEEAKVIYRRYLENETAETYIHNDILLGKWTGLLFLNRPEQCFGGTAFWRHKKFGWEAGPNLGQVVDAGFKNSSEYCAFMAKEGFREDQWEMIDYVPMAFNRLVLFRSAQFHSRYPMKSFGTDLESARLLKVFFCKVSNAVHPDVRAKGLPDCL